MVVKVLIVDDMSSQRMVMSNFLAGEGYELLEATDGAEALEIIAEENPEVVILDVMMPKIDGIECCRRIKAGAATKEILVILVTSIGSFEQKREAYKAQCDSFITKPVNKSRLIGKIRLWLLMREKGKQKSG